MRTRAALALLSAVGMAAFGVTAVSARSAETPAVVVGGLPAGAPPAASAAEPAIPAPAGWPFPEAFPRTAGTGRLAAGASYWTDFVYDDHGAVGVEHSSPVAALAPSTGTYTYPAGPASGNGADIFRAAVGLTSDASYWRVDWTTLVDARVPIAEWTFDTDNKATTGAATWPAGARVKSAGIDTALVVSSHGAQLLRASDGQLLAALPTSVDLATRSFLVRIPLSVLPVAGTWKVRLAAGLADKTGRSFAPVPLSRGALPSEPPVYNVAFRTYRQEPASCGTCAPPNLKPIDHGAQTVDGNFWNESAQASALAKDNVAQFASTLRWSDLAAQRTTPEPQPTGTSTRWYVTTLNLGQGVVPNEQSSFHEAAGDLQPNFLSRVQPYTVYVPTSYHAGTPTPLTWVLHSLGVNHNQYAAVNPRTLAQLCGERHSICATTLGFGPDGWYFGQAEVDFWQVWHQLADSYTLDPTRTIISGYSMGGFGSYKLGLTYPDLFAAAMPLAGPPTCGTRIIGPVVAEAAAKGPCAFDSDTARLVHNARWLPYDIADGVVDELVPFSGVLEQVHQFTRAGVQYRFAVYPAADHMAWAVEDDWSSEITALGHPVVMQNPGTISYSWFPHGSNPALGLGPTGIYWVRNLQARAAQPGELASVNAASGALPERPHLVTRTHEPVLPGDPLPGIATIQSWTDTGPAPAPQPTLSLSFHDVAAAAVDLVRAGFQPTQQVRVTVTTDGPLELTLGSTAVHLNKGTSLVVV